MPWYRIAYLPKVVSDFEALMKKEGKHINIHTYKADHAFANPSSPKHDKAAAEDAHKRTIAFFKKEMELY